MAGSMHSSFEPPTPSGKDVQAVRSTWELIPDHFSDFEVSLNGVRCSLEIDWTKWLRTLRRAWDNGLIAPKDEVRETSLDWDLSSENWPDISALKSTEDDNPNLIPYRVRIGRSSIPEETAKRVGALLEWRLRTELFLALNLANPGSCNYFFPDKLFGWNFGSAMRIANVIGWPQVSNIGLGPAAEYLRILNIRSHDSAGRHQGPKALFALLNLSRMGGLPNEGFLWTVVALESLYRIPRDKGGFHSAAEFILDRAIKKLGTPSYEESAYALSSLQSFYKHRKDILHDVGVVYRPLPEEDRDAPREDERFVLALIIATLQSKARGTPIWS